MSGTRQPLLLGIAATALGLLCLLGGVALLIWRVTAPDDAVVLLPNMVATLEDTPTPAALGTPLAPPPAPDDPAQIVILPVSASATPTPTETNTATSATSPPDDTPDTVLPPSHTPTTTHTALPVATQRTNTPPTPPDVAHTAIPTRAPIVPQRILIDRIQLDAPVVPVGQHTITLDNQVFSQWDVPDQRAAGWHLNSAALDEPGNLVLNGHHNTNGEVFRYLIALEPGDVITLQGAQRRYHYIVVQTMTLPEQAQPLDVRRANARWILPTNDERVTLITCWPYYSNTHRLVVVARPLEDVIPPAAIP